jgi:hypothetical protein
MPNLSRNGAVGFIDLLDGGVYRTQDDRDPSSTVVHRLPRLRTVTMSPSPCWIHFNRCKPYARQVHVRLRKGTQVPYMTHLLGVASLVFGDVSDPDL